MGLKRWAGATEGLVDTVKCFNLFLLYKPIEAALSNKNIMQDTHVI